jgi:hypothetical protein
LFQFFRFFSSQRKPKRILLKQSGEFHHLRKIYDEINSQYFDGKLNLNISWFGKKNAMAKRRIVFGAYLAHLRLIKIHRRLDQKEIPLFFVSFIVYHEMLHHVIPPLSGPRGRRQIHHKFFREQEKKFPAYALAKKFQQEWKKRL